MKATGQIGIGTHHEMKIRIDRRYSYYRAEFVSDPHAEIRVDEKGVV